MKILNAIVSALFWIYFIVTLVVVYPFAVLTRLLTFWEPTRALNHNFSRAWSFLYSAVNPYWKITTSDLDTIDPNKTYLIIANHNSFIDILVLYRIAIHFKWVAKDVLFYVPFLGWNMQLCGYIKIKRGDERSRQKLFETCSYWLKRGVSVLFFPEGTRSKDGQLKPFKPGAFKLAVEHHIPVLPLVLTGTRDALPARSVIFSHRAHMNIRALKPIHPNTDPHIDVATKTQNLMHESFEALKAALENK